MAIRAVKEPRLGVKLAAFPYQDAAAERVRELEYAAVFHEQGLGKHEDRRRRPHVVAPKPGR